MGGSPPPGSKGRYAAVPTRAEGSEPPEPSTFAINHEHCRLAAYIGFWVMVAQAYAVTKWQGWPVDDNTPLAKMFGYNNICVYWDYGVPELTDPKFEALGVSKFWLGPRETTGLLFPFVELAMIAYFVLFHAHVYDSFQKKKVSAAVYRMAQVTLPIELILMAWFRMIFVLPASSRTREARRASTASSVGVEGRTSLRPRRSSARSRASAATRSSSRASRCSCASYYYYKLNRAILDTVAIYLTGRGFPDSIQWKVEWLYQALVHTTTLLKLTISTGALTGTPYILDTFTENATARDKALAKALDTAWMIFNAILPALFAYIQSRTVATLKFTIDSIPQAPAIKGGAPPAPEAADGLEI